jgi:hypothetical protein
MVTASRFPSLIASTLWVPGTGFHRTRKSGGAVVPMRMPFMCQTTDSTPTGARASKVIFSLSSGISGSRRKLSPWCGLVMVRVSSDGIEKGVWNIENAVDGHSGEKTLGGSRKPCSRDHGRTSGGKIVKSCRRTNSSGHASPALSPLRRSMVTT